MRLTDQERSLAWERGELIRKRQNTLKHQTKINDQLRKAKVASRLTPLLPDQMGQPGMSFPHPTRPYTHPNETKQRTSGCWWCGTKSALYGHKSKDCALPHQRCNKLLPGRCLVPDHHSEYYSFIDHPQTCPYRGQHNGRVVSGEHA